METTNENEKNSSPELGELFKAISKAQIKIVSPVFDKEAKIPMKRGGQFTFKYASLNAVQTALKGPLSENGICYMQFPTSNGNKVSIETIVGHSSGQWMSRKFNLSASSSDVKEIGSCVTYAKRYSLCAIFNLTAQEDMDATSVSDTYVGSEDQKRWLTEKLKEMGVLTSDMAEYHKTLLDNKLPASDASILSIVEGSR